MCMHVKGISNLKLSFRERFNTGTLHVHLQVRSGLRVQDARQQRSLQAREIQRHGV